LPTRFSATTKRAIWRRRGARSAALLITGATMLLPVQRGAAFDDRFGESPEHDRAFNARSRGDVATLDKVIAAAHVKGKVLDVRLQGKKYLIKFLDESGRVTVVEISAAIAGRGDDASASNGRGPGSGSSGTGGGFPGSGGGGGGPGPSGGGGGAGPSGGGGGPGPSGGGSGGGPGPSGGGGSSGGGGPGGRR
jgi:hypothetical protein